MKTKRSTAQVRSKKTGKKKQPARAESHPLTLAVLGCGSMGSSILIGAASSPYLNYNLIACDPNAKKLATLSKQIGVATTTSVAAACAAAHVVILAMKPKDLNEALAYCQLRTPIFLSVVAGATISQIKKRLPKGAKVARVMPNLAISIGLGMSCIYSPDRAASAAAEEIFGSSGLTVHLKREELIRAPLGISASGAAFMLRFLSAIAKAGVDAGLDPRTSRQISAQTMFGAAGLVLEVGVEPEQIIRAIATPGGTTEAGFKFLDKGKFDKLSAGAVKAAIKRGNELAGAR